MRIFDIRIGYAERYAENGENVGDQSIRRRFNRVNSSNENVVFTTKIANGIPGITARRSRSISYNIQANYLVEVRIPSA